MSRESPRIRRLRSDRRSLEQLRQESTIFDFEADGEPAENYVLTFHGMGLWRPADQRGRASRNRASQHGAGVELRSEHRVRIELGASYPRGMPGLNWLTPVFHPNISSAGVVCLGEYGTHWVPSVDLAELCHMLWDMIRYENYDVDSPYNREAAMWAKSQTRYIFPVDPRPLRNKLASQHRSEGPPPIAKAVQSDVWILDGDAPVIDAEIVSEDDSEEDILFLD